MNWIRRLFTKFSPIVSSDGQLAPPPQAVSLAYFSDPTTLVPPAAEGWPKHKDGSYASIKICPHDNMTLKFLGRELELKSGDVVYLDTPDAEPRFVVANR